MRRWLWLGVLLLPMNADARMKAGPVVMSPHVRVWTGGSGGGPPPAILLSGATNLLTVGTSLGIK
jgi:hypothetical protein